MSRAATVAASIAATAVLAACGGSDDPAPAAKDAAPTGAPTVAVHVGGKPGTAAPFPAPTATSGPASGPTAAPGKGSGPSTATGSTPVAPPAGASPSSTRPSPTHIELNATLAKTCVRPGETQTITLVARPNMRVLVNTGYADRQDGTVHGGRYSDGSTDASGRFSATWTVSPTAPHGDASTQVAAVDEIGSGTKRIGFRVAAVC